MYFSELNESIYYMFDYINFMLLTRIIELLQQKSSEQLSETSTYHEYHETSTYHEYVVLKIKGYN